MSKDTIKSVSVQRKITRKTKLLKVEIDGDIIEVVFDPSEFPDDFTHDTVVNSYLSDGIKIIDWTDSNYFS